MLEREILEIANRERERFARDLHDGLCQSLAGIAALSSALSRSLAADADPTASATAAEIARLLNETNRQVRGLAHGLGPIGLDGSGLPDALETLTQNIRHLFHVSCTLESDRFRPRLGRETEAHLYRITQEAVRNAITHGRADRIDIRLTCDVRRGALRVQDNGVGLPEDIRIRHGIGLHTMAYRARAIHGSFKVARHRPCGTVVTCVFPVPRAQDKREAPDRARDNG